MYRHSRKNADPGDDGSPFSRAKEYLQMCTSDVYRYKCYYVANLNNVMA